MSPEAVGIIGIALLLFLFLLAISRLIVAEESRRNSVCLVIAGRAGCRLANFFNILEYIELLAAIGAFVFIYWHAYSIASPIPCFDIMLPLSIRHYASAFRDLPLACLTL